jgi:glucan-binding YG repeat protein
MKKEYWGKGVRRTAAWTLALATAFSLLSPGGVITSLAEGTEVVKNAEQLTTALESGGEISLGDDISVNDIGTIKKNTTIDLNQHKLSLGAKTCFIDGANVTFKNGKVITSNDEALVVTAAIQVNSNSELNLNDITMDTWGAGVFAVGKANVQIDHSTIDSGTYAVTTNANSEKNYGVTIQINNSNLSTSYDDSSPVLINVPGTLEMNGCTVTGHRQSVIVRCGDATITNCTITNDGSYKNKELYLDGNWKTGNEVPMAALVVGNHDQGTGYNNEASVVLKNTKITSSKVPAIYMDSVHNQEGIKVSLSIDGEKTDVEGDLTIKGDEDTKLEIAAGHFSDEVSDKYLATGKKVIRKGSENVVVDSSYATDADLPKATESDLPKATDADLPDTQPDKPLINDLPASHHHDRDRSFSSSRNVNSTISGRWENYDPANHTWHFINSAGQLVKNVWAKISATANGVSRALYYHFDSDGNMQTGWLMDQGTGKWYYLSKEHDGWFGSMQTGWHYDKEDGRWYYLDANGAMQTGWQKVDGKWYYLTPSNPAPTWSYDGTEKAWKYTNTKGRPLGSMYQGEQTPDGYTVDGSGAWQN